MDWKYCWLYMGCRISPFGNNKWKSFNGRASVKTVEEKTPGLDQGGWLPLLTSYAGLDSIFRLQVRWLPQDIDRHRSRSQYKVWGQLRISLLPR